MMMKLFARKTLKRIIAALLNFIQPYCQRKKGKRRWLMTFISFSLYSCVLSQKRRKRDVKEGTRSMTPFFSPMLERSPHTSNSRLSFNKNYDAINKK